MLPWQRHCRCRSVSFVMYISGDVNFCKEHRNKIEVPDPLAVEDLISSKVYNKRKLARLIIQYLNFEFLRYFFHRYLSPSPVYQSFVIIYLFIC